MLVRADPTTDSISLLSFPRDMRVEIRCPGRTPFRTRSTRPTPLRAAGLARDREAADGCSDQLPDHGELPRLPSDRRPPRRRWIDVDRRYFNDRGGPAVRADQPLPGLPAAERTQALDYVRYRHTDSDLYRVARQQQFVKAFKGQIQESFAPTRAAEGRQRGHAQRRGRAGRRRTSTAAPSSRTRSSPTGSPRGTCSRPASRGSRGSTTSPPTPRTSRGPSRPSRTPTSTPPRTRRPSRSARSSSAGAGSERDHDHGAERQRGRRLRVDRGLPPWSARLPGPHAAERAPRERSHLRLLPTKVYYDRRSGARRRRRRKSRTSSAPPR